jgi:hypothetical protein
MIIIKIERSKSMKIIKVISKQTYTGKDGKEYHYNNYAIVLPSGRKSANQTSICKKIMLYLMQLLELIDNRK